ncbi:MAG: enoyl-ACP reductase [Gammaproteobacteria bacterium]|jgi:enoyl-[acyl-carrier protein] reductase I|nr:enoyl-ACP reductase [Gammaproteobacteria bacterium]
MGFLENKRALIIGVASNRSIAWGVADAMHKQGAELAFTYQNEKLQSRVEKLATATGSNIVLPCDVASDESITDLFSGLKQSWSDFDILVHSVAFAPKEELAGDFVENTTREGSRLAHEISSYSLTALAKAARPMLRENSSIMSLSYLGAVRSMPNYNVMGLAKASLEANIRYMAYAMGPSGVRVNGISAGPIRTLAAAGIGDFRKMLDHVEENAPLRKNVSIEEVGNAAAFLCSDLASGITGEITYVDAGYSTVGMSGY